MLAGAIAGLLAIGIVSIYSLSILYSSPASIEDSYDEAVIHFAVNRTLLVWPQECLQAEWSTDQIQAVMLNDEPIVGQGQRAVCVDNGVNAAVLKVIFRDGTVETYTHQLSIVNQRVVLVGLVVVVCLLGFAYRVAGVRLTTGYAHLFSKPRERRYAFTAYAFLSITIAALILGLVSRTVVAFSTDKMLTADERFYTSIAVTGANGFGLYPYLQNYEPMPIMGGIGYATSLYVLSVKVFGPTIYALRLVSLIAGISALIPIFLITRWWYGSATGLVAVALTPFLYLYVGANTVRMDSITIAFVAWSLLVVAYSFRQTSLRWHVISGLLFGLALQAHLHAIAVAIGCGVLYLASYVQSVRRTKKWIALQSPLGAYVLGFSMGLAVYILFNVLPDTNSFLNTAGRIRIARARTQVGFQANSLLETFTSPTFMLNKELIRYNNLLYELPLVELMLFVAGIFALAVRRTTHDARTAIIFIGSVVGGAVILFRTDTLYLRHLFPALMLPIAPLLTHGFTGIGQRSWKQVSPLTVIVFLFVVTFLAQPQTEALRNAPSLGQFTPLASAPEFVQRVRAIASLACEIAGDGRLFYMPYFVDYPRFHSTFPSDEGLGFHYLGVESAFELWQVLKPDLVFGSVGDDLQRYIADADYREIEPDIWVKTVEPLTDGCTIVG